MLSNLISAALLWTLFASVSAQLPAALTASGQSCPANEPISCSADAQSQIDSIDSCCDSPGSVLLSTQFWTTDGVTAPSTSWGVHGLWSDNCDGSFPVGDPSRGNVDIQSILADGGAQSTLDYMNTYWIDNRGNNEQFYEHEWSKHGTTISTIVPACFGPGFVEGQDVIAYFEKAVSLFQGLPTYDWLAAAGITPDSSATYALADLQAVANSNFGFDAVWGCKNGALDQVFWAYNTQGSLANGQFVATNPLSRSTCPDQGIRYLPKNN